MIAISKAKIDGVGLAFELFDTPMKSTRNSKVVLYGNRKRAGINELPDLKPASSGRSDVVFLNAGSEEAMRQAHRRICQTAVDTLHGGGHVKQDGANERGSWIEHREVNQEHWKNM